MKKSKSRRSSPAKRIFGAIFYVGVLGAALGAGVVGNMVSRSSLVGKVFTNPMALLNSDPKATFHKSDGLNLLILGCDESRVHTGFDSKGHSISKVVKKYARADMILVARLDFATNSIRGLSVPRDTACRLPGYSTKKINGYFSNAPKGEEVSLMTKAVEHVLPGVKIDRSVVLNYDAFQRLVDTVGGVTVNVPKKMVYNDDAGQLHINIPAGQHTLGGYDAMGFVRFRHDRESDYGRQDRQKQFLAAFKNSIFKNLMSLPEIAEQSKTVLNNALSDDEIIALVAFARKVPSTNIKMGMLPTKEGRGSMLRVDEDKRDIALREFGLVGTDRRTARVDF